MLSVIIPVFNEEASVQQLYTELEESLERLGMPYEVIFVDDGSTDGTFPNLLDLANAKAPVVVVQLRRNFGQTAALSAGIDVARGDLLVVMDGDLQADPAEIPRLVAKLDEGYDVVSGWRRSRRDPALTRRLPSRLANWLISAVTGVRLNDYGGTPKVYRREVLEKVRLYGEMHRFLPAYVAWAGASIVEVPVNHRPRLHGRSKYGLSRTFKVLLDLITVKFLYSYSTKPIYVFGGLGLALLAAGLLAFGTGAYLRVVHDWHLNRNPLLTLGVMLWLIGFQFIGMGLLAELIIRTYHESQGKPIYTVRRVVRRVADTVKS